MQLLEEAATEYDLIVLDAPPLLLAFLREYESETLLCLFNMGAEPLEFAHGLMTACEPLPLACGDWNIRGDRIRLAPYSAWFGSCSKASSTASMGSSTQR